MKFLALISSVPFESDKIKESLKAVGLSKIAGKTTYIGKLANRNVLLVNSGIGKVNSAHSLTALIEHYPIECVINFGIGGAYPETGLKAGDIAIALEEIYGDEGIITPEGWIGIKKIGIPLIEIGKKRRFNEFPLDKKLARYAINVVKLFTHHPSPSPFSTSRRPQMEGIIRGMVKAGNFVTVSAVTGTPKRARELKDRFNAICENMEGAAIAQICTMYKIPMLEIRGISNIVGVRDKRKWNLKLASGNCQRAVLSILDNGYMSSYNL